MKKQLLILILLCGCVSQEPYFCRQDPCDKVLIHSLDQANSEISCAIYSFTLDSVSSALLDAKARGVLVRLVVESQQANVTGSEFHKLKQEGLEIRLDGNSRLMHHKFCVIDTDTVLTGSYNWSEQATNYNDENLVVLKSGETAEKFRQEFNRIWEVAQ
jgi:phosphatidylserine/phosphatidylglycerophosphate/cardiolipin synthase-like enzyme